MSGSKRGEQPDSDGNTPHDLRWLDVAPVLDGEELPDEEIPILDEPPIVTEARGLPGGPYLLAPDSAEQMPTDFLAVGGDTGVANVIKEAKKARKDESQLEARMTSEGGVVIPQEQYKFLEEGGQAAQQLLTTLKRGLEATTPELEAASIARLIKAGLL
jgi:hypothetical protein